MIDSGGPALASQDAGVALRGLESAQAGGLTALAVSRVGKPASWVAACGSLGFLGGGVHRRAAVWGV